jgi:CRISPR system Cascade subunit CasC
MALYVDLHVLQTVPPSNLNRDDTGSPKSAYYGGVRRVRVSSQAWKKAMRGSYKDHLDEADLGVRTKRAVELLVARIRERNSELDEAAAIERATKVFEAMKIKVKPVTSKTRQKALDAGDEVEREYPTTEYLIFWSNRQLDRLAELAAGDQKIDRRSAADAADNEHGIEIALFGRMVADAADINVDATIQVAHALSTHAAEIEQDYFTAVDDQNPEEETGAGMIGTVEFNSATLYRHATVNVDGLRANLADDEATVRAVEAAVRAFTLSMPTGKQNTFANRTVPDGLVVCVRGDQPINLVGAFEDPVAPNGGFVAASARALVEHAQGVGGMLSSPDATYVAVGSASADVLGELATPRPLESVVSAVGARVREHLTGPAS